MLMVLRGPAGDPICRCYRAQEAFRWLPALVFSYSYSWRRDFHGEDKKQAAAVGLETDYGYMLPEISNGCSDKSAR